MPSRAMPCQATPGPAPPSHALPSPAAGWRCSADAMMHGGPAPSIGAGRHQGAGGDAPASKAVRGCGGRPCYGVGSDNRRYIGVIGINHAPYCTTYEGDRSFRTDGKRYKHPIDEADEAEKRLLRFAAPTFDEFLVLRFEGINEPPYGFAWTDERATALDYGAALARVGRQYEART